MATLPRPTAAAVTTAARPAPAAETRPKRVPGVPQENLVEERQPLLDLDGLDQGGREALHTAFDIPPPPPVAAAQGSSGAVYINGVSDTAAQAAAGAAAEAAEESASSASSSRDFRSLYGEEERQAAYYPTMYPALAPTAPAAAVPSAVATAAAFSGEAAAAEAVRVTAAQPEGPATSAAASRNETDDTEVMHVVDALLAENERLRLKVEQLEERDRNRTDSLAANISATVAGDMMASAFNNGFATQMQRQQMARGQAVAAPQSASYPGATHWERQQQQRATGATQTPPRWLNNPPPAVLRQQPAAATTAATSAPTAVKHFRCQCTQFLQVPVQAELVYCPTCGHTSQATRENTFSPPLPRTSAPPVASQRQEDQNGGGGLLSCVRGILY